MSQCSSNNELCIILNELIKTINTNTNTFKQYLENNHVTEQIQDTADRTTLKDIGNNTVNVINYTDPDTFSNALSNNETYISTLSAAISQSISELLLINFEKILQQNGLINVDK